MPTELERKIFKGIALADAMGTATQGLSLNGIHSKYGSEGIQSPPIPLLISDGTQQAIAAYSTKNLETITSTELNNLSFAALAGITFQMNDAMLPRMCSDLKNDPDKEHQQSILAGIATAYVMTLALDDIHPEQYLAKVWELCSGIDEEFDMTIRKIGHVLGWGSEIHAIRHLGDGKQPYEIVTLALYCVMRYPDSYVDAVCRAANTPGNSHIIAAITGAIMSARNGVDDILQDWQNLVDLENLF